MKTLTHNERVLRLLSDRFPHSHHELYALHVIAHSRISDLRKQGHVIEQWREGDHYVYRLLSSPETAPKAEPDERIAETDGGLVQGQLSLIEAVA